MLDKNLKLDSFHYQNLDKFLWLVMTKVIRMINKIRKLEEKNNE